MLCAHQSEHKFQGAYFRRRQRAGHHLLDIPDCQCRLDDVYRLDFVVGIFLHTPDITGLIRTKMRIFK